MNLLNIKLIKELKAIFDAKETKEDKLSAAEEEVAAKMDAILERARVEDGWDITDVASKVDVGVRNILDDHGIDDATKEKAMDHLNIKLIKELEEISDAKETIEDRLSAAEEEVAAKMDAILERARV